MISFMDGPSEDEEEEFLEEHYLQETKSFYEDRHPMSFYEGHSFDIVGENFSVGGTKLA